jgi:hypothetical protein
MGMMNNCCYRVKIHTRQTSAGGFALQFEHPTIAGPTVGGWMNRAEEADAKAAAAVVSPSAGALGCTAAELLHKEAVHASLRSSAETAWGAWQRERGLLANRVPPACSAGFGPSGPRFRRPHVHLGGGGAAHEHGQRLVRGGRQGV